MLKLFPCGEQTTISASASIECRGFYHGGEVRLICKSASVDTGIVFMVDDTLIPACHTKSITTPWHITALGYNHKQCVHHVEHVLSAVRGLGIDNIIIQLEGVPYLPILDGSALPYINLLQHLICSIPGSEKKIARVVEEFTIADEESASFAFFRPPIAVEGGLVVTSLIDFPDSPIGTQLVTTAVTAETYAQKIGHSRTFFHRPHTTERWVRVRELFKTLPEEVAESPVIAWNEHGFLSPLRFSNEPGTHKILDFIGDAALCGYQLCGDVFLNRPSHRFNRMIAARLARSF